MGVKAHLGPIDLPKCGEGKRNKPQPLQKAVEAGFGVGEGEEENTSPSFFLDPRANSRVLLDSIMLPRCGEGRRNEPQPLKKAVEAVFWVPEGEEENNSPSFFLDPQSEPKGLFGFA